MVTRTIKLIKLYPILSNAHIIMTIIMRNIYNRPGGGGGYSDLVPTGVCR